MNMAKRKVKRPNRDEDIRGVGIVVNGEVLEQVENLRYLGVEIKAGVSMEAEMSLRMGEGVKVLGLLRGVRREGEICMWK